MQQTSKQRAEEYAKLYPFVRKDGFYGPVSIANVGQYNGRDIVNLCVRTEKSGVTNAAISFPTSWNKAEKFTAGTQVNFKVEDGYVKNIWIARPMSLPKLADMTAVEMSRQEEERAGEAVEKLLEEVTKAATNPATNSDTEGSPF